MTFLSILFSLSSLFACTDRNEVRPGQEMKEALQNLSGTYMDEVPYAYGEAFGQRIFTFDEGKWTLSFTLGLDPKLENEVFQFRTVGTYQVLDQSNIVENAFNALFLEDKKYITLKTDIPNLAEAFGFSTCGLIKDVEKDISEVGCATWAAVTDCNEDHDLLSLDENGLLHFGERPADNNMCTVEKRPTKLTPGVKKVGDFFNLKLDLENLEGVYADEFPLARANGTFGHRHFIFKDGTWELRFTLAFDPALQTKIFEFRTGGKYEILEKWKQTSNAYAGIFYEDEKYLTLRTDNPDVIQGFGFEECGLEINVEKNISETGCTIWKSVKDCSEDHDIVSMDHFGQLYFGERPLDNDMCTADKRPSFLTEPVTKQ